MMKRLVSIAVLVGFLSISGWAWGANAPRDYIPAPPGCLAILMYYTHSSADSLYFDGKKVADDVDFKGNVGLFRPVYYMEAGPFLMDPQLILPFGDLSLESDDLGLDLSSTGIGDPILLATLWLLHNPESKTWLGFTPFFFLPIGEYDNDGALSLGENRWRFRTELGFVKGFEVLAGHNAYFELTLGGDFFLENDDFGPESSSLEQDPVFNLETHVNYDITDSFFVSGDYYYRHGGETEIDGLRQDDTLNTHTLGFSLGYNIATNYQLLFQYQHDVDVDSGLPTQALTFRFMYACDVGYLFGKSAAGK